MAGESEADLGRQVYSSADTQRLGNTWAPEIHQINGKWYMYYSLDYKPQVLTGGSSVSRGV